MRMPPIHPAANLFPMLSDSELHDLSEDIKTHGLREPIVMLGKQLLDGRNRWKACALARVKPRLRKWAPESSSQTPTEFVISINVKRRHLSPSQLAAVAIDALPLLEAEAKKRQKAHGGTAPGKKNTSAKDCSSDREPQARDKAAKATGTNRQYVSDMKAIQKKAPYLVKKVRDGEITVPEAKAIALLEPEDQGLVFEKLENGQARTVKEVLAQIKRDIRMSKIAEVSASNSPLNLGARYPVILADPPWRYDDSASRGAAEDHYPTMSLDELLALPVGEHATEDAALFLWATSALLREALQVMAAWGFEYRSSAVWVKPRIGLGHWFRVRHEFLLVGIRGNIPAPQSSDRPDSVISSEEIAKHSSKPAIVHALIESMWPSLSRLELFARGAREGWNVWGNQAGRAA